MKVKKNFWLRKRWRRCSCGSATAAKADQIGGHEVGMEIGQLEIAMHFQHLACKRHLGPNAK